MLIPTSLAHPESVASATYFVRNGRMYDASRVQLLASAVGYPSGAVFGCPLHFRTHRFALPPDRHRSPFGSPAPRFFSWRIRVLPASVSCLLAQCAVSSAGAGALSCSDLFSSRLSLCLIRVRPLFPEIGTIARRQEAFLRAYCVRCSALFLLAQSAVSSAGAGALSCSDLFSSRLSLCFIRVRPLFPEIDTIARRQEALLRACCVRCLAFVVCDVSSAGDFGGREVPARSRSSCPLAVRCLC